MGVRLSRRQFAVGLGASLLAAPYLSLLRGRSARAQTSEAARRLIIVFTPNGTVHRHWNPRGSGPQIDIAPGTILEALIPHRDDILIVGGLDFFEAHTHQGGMAAMLTGNGGAGSSSGGLSVDQFIAREIGDESRFRSIELGVQTSRWGGGVQTRMSYSGPGSYVPPEDRPRNAFQRLYGDVLGGADEVAARLARKQSILDTNREEIARIRGWVGAIERDKLDAHLDSLREVERGLLSAGVGECDAPGALPQIDVYDHANFPLVGRQQMDLLVSALSCGLTRVATLQWAHTVAPTVCSWLNISTGHHTLSHAQDSSVEAAGQFVQAERWFAEQFAYLLDRLSNTPEPDGEGSLLDHSVVLWCKEMGDSRRHVCDDVPFVLAGRGGGLRPGRYLRFDGQPHNKLLVSLCHAMGLNNQTFGNGAYGTGPLEGLT